MNAKNGKESIWSAPFIILMAANFFNMVSCYFTMTVMPVYLTYLGVDVGMIGVIVGIMYVSAIATRPFFGPAFDSFSLRNILILTQIIVFFSLLGYAFITDPNLILIVRLVHGASFGASAPACIALVSKIVPRSSLATGVGTFTISISTAQVLAPAISLFLVDLVGFRLMYLITATITLVSGLCLLAVKESKRELLPYKLQFNRFLAKEIFDKALVVSLFAMSYSTINTFLVLMSYEYGIENVGFFFAIYGLGVILIAPQYGRLADRYGAEPVLLFGVIVFIIAIAILSISHSIPMLVVAAILNGFGYGSLIPQIQSLAMRSTDISRSGVVNNTYYMGTDIGMVLGPIIGGFAIELLMPVTDSMGAAYSGMWLVMVIPLVLGLIIIIYWNIKKRKKGKDLSQGGEITISAEPPKES